MTFILPDLPFAEDALEPHISAETMRFHHGKHHAAYVKKTNAALEEKGGGDRRLSDVIRGAREKGDTGLFNNSAQLWNHSFFWKCLSPERQQPGGKLASLIDESFGSTEALLSKLGEEATGHFSNGWAWLVLDRDQLKVTSLHDADTPLVHEGMVPLLTLDVWEHAYYIDYRNERPKFVEAVLGNIVNWDFVAQNLDCKGIERADQEPSSARATESA